MIDNNSNSINDEILKLLTNINYIKHDKKKNIAPHAILDITETSSDALYRLKRIFEDQKILFESLIDIKEGKNYLKVTAGLESYSLGNLQNILKNLTPKLIEMAANDSRIIEVRKHIKNLDWKLELGKEEEKQLEIYVKKQIEKESLSKTKKEKKLLETYITEEIFDGYDCGASKQNAIINKIDEKILSEISKYLLSNDIKFFMDKIEISILGFSNIRRFNQFCGLEEIYRSHMENKKKRTGEDVIQESRIEVGIDRSSSVIETSNEKDLELLREFLNKYAIIFIENKDVITIGDILPHDLIKSVGEKDYTKISALQQEKLIEQADNIYYEQAKFQNNSSNKLDKNFSLIILSNEDELNLLTTSLQEYNILFIINYDNNTISIPGVSQSDSEKYITEKDYGMIYALQQEKSISYTQIDKEITSTELSNERKELHDNSDNKEKLIIKYLSCIEKEYKKLKKQYFSNFSVTIKYEDYPIHDEMFKFYIQEYLELHNIDIFPDDTCFTIPAYDVNKLRTLLKNITDITDDTQQKSFVPAHIDSTTNIIKFDDENSRNITLTNLENVHNHSDLNNTKVIAKSETVKSDIFNQGMEMLKNLNWIVEKGDDNEKDLEDQAIGKSEEERERILQDCLPTVAHTSLDIELAVEIELDNIIDHFNKNGIKIRKIIYDKEIKIEVVGLYNIKKFEGISGMKILKDESKNRVEENSTSEDILMQSNSITLKNNIENTELAKQHVDLLLNEEKPVTKQHIISKENEIIKYLHSIKEEARNDYSSTSENSWFKEIKENNFTREFKINDLDEFLKTYNIDIDIVDDGRVKGFRLLIRDIDKIIKILNIIPNDDQFNFEAIKLLNNKIKTMHNNDFSIIFQDVSEKDIDSIVKHLFIFNIISSSLDCGDNIFSISIEDSYGSKEKFRKYKESITDKNNDRSI